MRRHPCFRGDDAVSGRKDQVDMVARFQQVELRVNSHIVLGVEVGEKGREKKK